MTKEQLKQANELEKKINNLTSFLTYLKRDDYRLSIKLTNVNPDNYHSKVIHLKKDDNLIDVIKDEIVKRTAKLTNDFEEL